MYWKNLRQNNDQHVVPDPDVKPHVTGMSCWCRPARDERQDNVVIHNCFYIGDEGEGRVPLDGIYH